MDNMTPAQPTTPTASDLLTRYASDIAYMRGVEGVPEFPGWIDIEREDDYCITDWDGVNEPTIYADNPDAVLAGVCGWVMEVYGWAWFNGHYNQVLELHHARNDVQGWLMSILRAIVAAVKGEVGK